MFVKMFKFFLPVKFISLFFIISFSGLFAQSQKFEVEKINFEGNQNISSSELSGIIATQESPGWFLKTLNKIYSKIGREPVYFDSTLIPIDIRALDSYYKDNGYFEIKVKADYKIIKEKEEAEITYRINEGPQFQISGFAVSGLNDLQGKIAQDVNNIINDVDSTKYFTRNFIDTKRQQILSRLLNRGFMTASSAERNVYIDSLTNTVDVQIAFQKGKRYRFGEIRISKSGPGKENVDDSLIKKISDLKPGEYYSFDEIRRSQVRLVRSNLFTSVLVNTVTGDTVQNVVPVEITGDIGHMNELAPEVILNNQASAFNVGLGASYTRKNFLGNARNLSVRSTFAIQDVFNVDYTKVANFLAPEDTSILGYFDNRITLNQPYTFNRRIFTTLDGYYTINKQKEYKSTIWGSKISFDFEMPPELYVTSLVAYYNLERSRYDFQSDYIRRLLRNRGVEPVQIEELVEILRPSSNRNYFTQSIIGVDISANKVNDLIFPSSGYTLGLNIEEANSLPYLISQTGIIDLKTRAQFYRTLLNFTWFPNIYDSKVSTIGVKFKSGYVQTYKGSITEIPLNKRFTVGGSNSVRGWRTRELVPLDGNVDLENFSNEDIILFIENQLLIGGTFMMEGSVESRNRLFDSFGSAVFVDFGNAWNGYERFRFDEIAVAAGFGFRYYSDFAPIRFDIGFKAYDPRDRKNFFQKIEHTPFFRNVEFHIGLGEAF